MDVSQSSPIYEVRDVISPWGLLRDSVPIPGDIVSAMAESISELRSAFAPSILVGPPSTLSFVLDEGRGFGPPQQVQIANGGIYGSLLGVSLTTSASYIRVAPDRLGNLAFNESGVVDTLVDSTNLLAVNSPYAATIVIQDPNALNTPQVVPITIAVRPKAIISAAPLSIEFAAVTPGGGGAFPPIPSQQFIVQNTGPAGSVLEYQVQKLVGQSAWLVSFAPSTGSLVSTATQAVTVVVQPPTGLLPGLYTETLRVSGYSQNSYQDILIQLLVS
jgi:hypothetical protein